MVQPSRGSLSATMTIDFPRSYNILTQRNASQSDRQKELTAGSSWWGSHFIFLQRLGVWGLQIVENARKFLPWVWNLLAVSFYHSVRQLPL